MRTKLAVFSLIVFPVLLIDWVTKRWALDVLQFESGREILGGLVPLRFALNTGAAFGIGDGMNSRVFFIPVTIIALVLLGVLFKQAEKGDWLRLVSLSAVVAGALGNLYDRVRWNRGVVDFIGPIDLGFTNFPIFNVADIAISCGAVLLAISFWQEEKALKAQAQEQEQALSAAAASEAAGSADAAQDAPTA